MSAGGEPAVKRRRVEAQNGENGTRAVHRSRIFAPFRTVGLISPTPVPFAAIAQGKTTFQITTSVGRCLQTFDLRKGLNLVFITRPQTPGEITSTAAWADRVIASWATHGTSSIRGVWIYKRGKKVGELQMPDGWDENIVQLLVLGSWIVGCGTTKILVWKSATLESYATLATPYATNEDGRSVLTGGICNMPTFTNKIFAGREDGRVEMWNVHTAKLLYTFQPPSAENGPVTALQATPALSLLAIAYMNGSLIITDVEHDVRVLSINAGKGDQSPVTSISFRTDGLGAGPEGRDSGTMATASYNSGDVILWDLHNGGRKVGTLRGAHKRPSAAGDSGDGGISKIEFLPSQAILLTSGLDNSLKSWIFDEVPFSPVPRALHARSGHAEPVTTLNFLPSDADGPDAGGKWLLSTSEDRTLWGWSLRRDAQSAELSQGKVQKKAKALAGLKNSNDSHLDPQTELKAPPITCLACSLNRDGGIGTLPGVKTLWATAKQLKGKSTATEDSLTGWESIVTGHIGDKFARTWFWGRRRAGRWLLETGDGVEVKSVAISPCGTFALVGSAAGGIDMFNLQSGQHRQRFPARLTREQAKRQQQVKSTVQSNAVNGETKWLKGHGRHTAAVTGIAVDSLNQTVISCGADGKIKFWDFMTGSLVNEIDWSHFTQILSMRYHRANDLIAFNCNDSCIRIIDIETRRLVRELKCSGTSVNDLCFSNDGRWIVAAMKNAMIKVWDLPTGNLIDMMRLRRACTAIAFSNTGEFLATAMEDGVGIDIWSNRALFTHIPTRNLVDDNDAAEIQETTTSGEGGQGVLGSAFATDDSPPTEDLPPDSSSTVEQLSKTVETLSLLPKSRWQTLVHLDLIRERNKPKQPPKAPEQLPFFLSAALDKSKPPAADAVPIDAAERSRIARLSTLAATTTPFTALLRAGTDTSNYDAFLTHLKTLPPAATDLEIRSLSAEDEYAELVAFVHALTQRLRARRDYELVQAWMAVFLRVHGEVLALEDPDAEEAGVFVAEGVRAAVREWRAVQAEEAERLAGLVGYCRGVIGFLRGAL